MRLYAASSGSLSSVIGSAAAGRGVNGDGPSGTGVGGGGASSGCSPAMRRTSRRSMRYHITPKNTAKSGHCNP
jgi:hypothetical protein